MKNKKSCSAYGSTAQVHNSMLASIDQMPGHVLRDRMMDYKSFCRVHDAAAAEPQAVEDCLALL